jgi:hypothetical protein
VLAAGEDVLERRSAFVRKPGRGAGGKVVESDDGDDGTDRRNAHTRDRGDGSGAVAVRHGRVRILAAARRPVVTAELVDDRAADADARVGGEHLGAAVLARAEGVEEAEGAGGDQVFALHAAGQPAHEVRNDALDEREVLGDVLAGGVRRGGSFGGHRAGPLSTRRATRTKAIKAYISASAGRIASWQRRSSRPWRKPSNAWRSVAVGLAHRRSPYSRAIQGQRFTSWRKGFLLHENPDLKPWFETSLHSWPFS